MKACHALTVVVVLSLLASAASGGPAPRLIDYADIMPAFTGTAHFNSGDGFLVDLDYAVFEPAKYPGYDPSAGTDFVYAYQAIIPDLSNFALIAVNALGQLRASCCGFGPKVQVAVAFSVSVSVALPPNSIWAGTFSSPVRAQFKLRMRYSGSSLIATRTSNLGPEKIVRSPVCLFT